MRIIKNFVCDGCNRTRKWTNTSILRGNWCEECLLDARRSIVDSLAEIRKAKAEEKENNK